MECQLYEGVDDPCGGDADNDGDQKAAGVDDLCGGVADLDGDQKAANATVDGIYFASGKHTYEININWFHGKRCSKPPSDPPC